MKEEKNWGLNLAIVGFILSILFPIGGICYGIYNESKTCYNFTAKYIDGTTETYHCEYYNAYNNRYELHMHNGDKIILLKSVLCNISISEFDCNA